MGDETRANVPAMLARGPVLAAIVFSPRGGLQLLQSRAPRHRRPRGHPRQLDIFEGVDHYPHYESPARFVDVLVDFITSTAPAVVPAAGYATRSGDGRLSPAVLETDGSISIVPKSSPVVRTRKHIRQFGKH